MVYERYREIAKEMIMAGVKAADPTQAVMDSVKLSGKTLTVRGDTFNLEDYDKILVFGIGKAAAPMARALEQIVECDGGLVITKKGDEIGDVEVKSIPVYKAYHPEPREDNVKYSTMILDQIKALDPNSRTLVFFLITGGGSALFSVPPEGITIDDVPHE